MAGINDGLETTCFGVLFQDYSYFYNVHNLISKKKEICIMIPDKIILCEMKSGMFDAAVSSAICSVTNQFYPHFLVVQEFINYTLNANPGTDFSLLEEFFFKLLISHPPNSNMCDYYWIICDNPFVKVNGNNVENQGLFMWLLKTISIILKCAEESNNESNQEQINLSNATSDISFFNVKSWSFNALSSDEKIKRCLIALNFVIKILETNFCFWLYSEPTQQSSESDDRPLLSKIFWSNGVNIGLVNSKVDEVLNLFETEMKSKNGVSELVIAIQKIVSLTAEVIRCCDGKNGIRHFYLGSKLLDFTKKLSVILFEHIWKLSLNREFNTEIQFILRFKPSWLRAVICSYLLDFITGSEYPIGLTKVCDILEYMANGHNKFITKVQDVIPKKVNNRREPNFSLVKNINEQIDGGQTRLHKACNTNNVREVKALLKFSKLDVNLTDKNGWTPLHLAAAEGNTACIEVLLKYQPLSLLQKPVNTLCRGPQNITPLMCAIEEDRKDICTLLLEHSGSLLLEDINDFNQSPAQLSQSRKISKILKHYETNWKRTVHTHNNIYFLEVHKKTVLTLCVEMIQSYLAYNKAWNMYENLRQINTVPPSNELTSVPINENLQWNYAYYIKDLNDSIPRLRNISHKLAKIKEFKDLYEIYSAMISIDKW